MMIQPLTHQGFYLYIISEVGRTGSCEERSNLLPETLSYCGSEAILVCDGPCDTWRVLKKTWQAIVKMSLHALAAAYDSDSDLNNSEDENKVEREGGKGQNPVPLKRGLDRVLENELKKELGGEEEMVKLGSKKTKNIVTEQNLEEFLNVRVPKEEPKDEYGELEAGIGKEQIPGSSFGEVFLKRELKVEYSEFGIEAGVCKKEPKFELEEGEIQDEYGELGAGMGMKQILGSSFDPVSLTKEPKEEYNEFGIGDGKQQTRWVSFDVCKK